ncbi:MAG: SpvB/TcaC N-terminal domain-containing protein, partial [Gammaproteobacteria bacterium]
MDDIVLMAKDPSGTNYLFLGNQTGTFSKPDLVWTGTESAKAAWAAKMAGSASVMVTNTPSSGTASESQSNSQSTAQTRTSQSLQTPTDIGTDGGVSGVDGGAATFSIPIAVPPGRAGMQPGLSLNYSSRGGNGDVGVGWSLSGLSAITRCPATYAQDGYTQGVTYSASTDRLCLDGQHLIKITGTYGQSGSVYRTELDSLVRVNLSGGSTNSTSAYFEVDYEDGRKAYYGTSAGANSQFIASGVSYPLVWAISKEVDASGNNSVVYNYSAYGNGEYHISSIVYSGSANREVDFAYTQRTDFSSVYLAGGLTRQTQLLTAITTKALGNVVRQYSLSYSTSAATSRSLLSSEQECGYAPGSGSLECLPADTFDWQNQALSFGLAATVSLPSSVTTDSGIDCSYCLNSIQYYLSGTKDFDGDGQNELFYMNVVTGQSQVVWVNNPNNLLDFSSTFSQQFPGQDDDFLSTGEADAIGNDNGYVGISWCTNQVPCTTQNVSGSPNDFTLTQTSVPYSNRGAVTGQYTGDGLPDILQGEENPGGTSKGGSQYGFYLYPNTSTSTSGAPTFGSPVWVGPLPQYNGSTVSNYSSVGDMDGNGFPDLLITEGNTGTAVAFIQNTTGGASGVTATIKNLSTIGISENLSSNTLAYHTFMDINGDGLSDFVFVDTSINNDIRYQLNKGGTFGPVVDTGFAMPEDSGSVYLYDAILSGNLTNDAKSELLIPVNRYSTYCLRVWVKIDGAFESVDYCGDDLYSRGYGQFDHSVYTYQILKFIEQSNGTYAPTWVMNGSNPVTVNLEAGTAQVSDIYGTGLTGFLMLSSKWYLDGNFNQNDDFYNIDNCPSTGTLHCMQPLAKGYWTISPQGGAPDLMTGSTNGLGAQTSWQYQSLTSLKNTPVGTGMGYAVTRPCSTAPNTPGQLPAYYCFTSSMWVVSNYYVSNDVGGSNAYTYQYQDAVYNNQGRGFQGFHIIKINNLAASTQTVNTYHQDFPLSGKLTESQVYVLNNGVLGTLLSDTQNTWQQASPSGCLASNSVYWPQLSISTITRYDLNSGSQVSQTVTNYGYDGYGNTTSIAATTSDSTGNYSATTSYSGNSTDCTDWWLNKFAQKSVTPSVNYSNPIIAQPGAIPRSVNYTYTALPLRDVHTQNDDQGTAYEIDTTYGYDSYGNTNSVQVQNGSNVPTISKIATRTTSSDFTGTNGYFADSITNVVGQTASITTDPGTGLPTSESDPNGVQTAYGYDAFGRKTSEQVTAPIGLPAMTINYT